jgi:2'-5' RNA ligase
MRTFMAVELPVAVRSQVQTLQEQLQSELRRLHIPNCFRWTPVENLHITLRFLGETSPAQCAAIAQGLDKAASGRSPFSLHLRRLGAFPTLRRPNVLWLGIHGDQTALSALQAACEELARSLGFAPEERPFSPHLTLARAQRNADRQALAAAGDVLNELARLSNAPFLDNMAAHSGFTVNEVVHMQSELLPAGPVYTLLYRSPVKRPGFLGFTR